MNTYTEDERIAFRNKQLKYVEDNWKLLDWTEAAYSYVTRYIKGGGYSHLIDKNNGEIDPNDF